MALHLSNTRNIPRGYGTLIPSAPSLLHLPVTIYYTPTPIFYVNFPFYNRCKHKGQSLINLRYVKIKINKYNPLQKKTVHILFHVYYIKKLPSSCVKCTSRVSLILYIFLLHPRISASPGGGLPRQPLGMTLSKTGTP